MKAYSDLPQSKELAKYLSSESADMYYDRYGTPDVIDNIVTHKSIKTDKYQHLIPCWSLAALLDVLPEIQGSKPTIYLLDDNYITYTHMEDLHTNASNLVDACYEMILKLKEMNLI